MIIALVGQKGGVGKSSLAVNLAAEAVDRGHTALLVDADEQATARTWAAVGSEAGHPIPTAIAMGATMHKPGQLDRVGKGYDWIMIDSPPRLADIQRSALMAADLALLPCGPSASDTWAIASSVELVLEAQKIRPTLRGAIVITRKQGRTAIGQAVRNALEGTGLPLLRNELGYRVAFQEALAAGLGIGQYAPGTPASFEIRRLFDEVAALGTLDVQKDPEHRPAKAAARRR